MARIRRFTREELEQKKSDLEAELAAAKDARPVEDIEWDLHSTEFLLGGFNEADQAG